MSQKTPEAARTLGVSYHRLINLVRFGKVSPLPAKDSSGDYVWSAEDMRRARSVLGIRRQEELCRK